MLYPTESYECILGIFLCFEDRKHPFCLKNSTKAVCLLWSTVVCPLPVYPCTAVLLDESGTQYVAGLTQPFTPAFQPGLLQAFGQRWVSHSLCFPVPRSCGVSFSQTLEVWSGQVLDKNECKTSPGLKQCCNNYLLTHIYVICLCFDWINPCQRKYNCDYFNSEHVQSTYHPADLLCSQLSLCIMN